MNRLGDSAARLEEWIGRQDGVGWDPYDALNSPLLKRLTFGQRRLGQLWVQALKHSPINLRPWLGVRPGRNPKGLGLLLAAYVRHYRMTGQVRYLNQAQALLEWLRDHATPGYHGLAWGYHFDWPNRGFFAPAGTPTSVNTAFIGLACLDMYRLRLGVGADALAMARSACDFILHDLHRLRPAADELCFSYTPLDQRYVHNANVLAAWLLADVAAITGETHLADNALAASRYTARRQQSSGAWLYGEGARDHWVDNFHTGYVLTALLAVKTCLKQTELLSPIARGYDFWRRVFFLTDGTPKYYADRLYPIDIHCVAQAILTFLAFRHYDADAYDQARRQAEWGIVHMQDARGYFHYQIQRWYRIRIPYLRWSQAWMYRAMTELMWVESGQPLAVQTASDPIGMESYQHENLD